jgi:hypothetical protein
MIVKIEAQKRSVRTIACVVIDVNVGKPMPSFPLHEK